MTGSDRPTVLVVDDEPLLRSLTVRVLGRSGFHALAVGDGKSALELARTKPKIRALLLDLTLPPHGGVVVAEALRTLRPELVMILTSGEGPPPGVESLLASPYIEFLRKPFSPLALTNRLRELLDR